MTEIETIKKQFAQFGYTSHQYPNAIGMWPNEQECFIWSLFQADPTKTWIEIGAFCGGSAVLMSLVSRLRGGLNKVVSVDVNFAKWGAVFDSNVYSKGQFNQCHKLECHSWDLSKHYTYGDISFAFIDGWHSFASVLREFEQIDEYAVPGCIVTFHDTAKQPYTAQDLQAYRDAANANFNHLMAESKPVSSDNYHSDEQRQNFCVDEAIVYILDNYNYELLTIPVMTDEAHLDRAPIYERGTTSPYNALVAIRKLS